MILYGSKTATPARTAAAVPADLLGRRRMAQRRGTPRCFRRAGPAWGNRHGTRGHWIDSAEGRIRSSLDRTVSHWYERAVAIVGSNLRLRTALLDYRPVYRFGNTELLA